MMHNTPAKNKTYSQEVALYVGDYIDDGDDVELGFEDCACDFHSARLSFKEEAEETGVAVKKIKKIEFMEFDSANPTHACGIFLVTYIGQPFPEED